MDRDRRTARLMTFDEYLAFEERSPVKHEYIAGEVYAMSGVTTRHNLITLNMATHLRAAARARGCRVFATDVKVKVTDRVYYPDLMVACGKAAAVERIVEEPSLIVEVTSPSTRAIDRREKLEAYRRLPSLQLYLVVEQRRRHVLAYRREADGGWTREEVQGDGGIALPVLDTGITLAAIYDDVQLPPLTVREDEWALFDDEDVDDED
jgi:Uma2 family endonuclease